MKIFPSGDDDDPAMWRPSASLAELIRLAVALLIVVVVGLLLGLCSDLEGDDATKVSVAAGLSLADVGLTLAIGAHT